MRTNGGYEPFKLLKLQSYMSSQNPLQTTDKKKVGKNIDQETTKKKVFLELQD